MQVDVCTRPVRLQTETSDGRWGSGNNHSRYHKRRGFQKSTLSEQGEVLDLYRVAKAHVLSVLHWTLPLRRSQSLLFGFRLRHIDNPVFPDIILEDI